MSQTKLESTPQTQAKKSQPTVMQSIISGSVAGAAEVFIDHPLWTIKTRMQTGKSFTLNPQLLYRGVLPNAASMSPITALQVGLNRLFQGEQQELSTTERLGAAFAAGAASAFVGCPTEMVMAHQKTSFYASGAHIVEQGGWSSLYTGLFSTMLREGMFGLFFLGVSPMLKKRIEPHCPNDFTATIASGSLAGVGATIASQAADVVKAIQQDTGIGMKKAMEMLYTTKGIGGFFSGIAPRGTRVVSAVTIMSLVTEQMKGLFAEQDEDAYKPK